MTMWQTGRWYRWMLLGLFAMIVMYGAGRITRMYLYDLAGRSIPSPPTDDPLFENVRFTASASRQRNLDGIAGVGIASDGPFLDAPGFVHVLNDGSPDAIAGDYILTVRDAAARERLLALARTQGIRVVDRHGNMVRVRVADRQRLAALLARMADEVDVEANVRMRIPLLDDPGEALPAPASPYSGFGDQALAWLGIPEPDTEWGRGVRVAVLDTGVLGIPAGQRVDLVGQGVYGEHGALVARILQQSLPAATLLDFQVMSADGTGDAYTVAKGIREAVDAGADLINMSIGTRGDSRTLAAAIRYAQDQGVLVVASAGNEGVERVSFPAAYEGVLSVAAVDAEERHLYFSNRGERVDLAAPGVGVAIPLQDEDVRSFSGTSAAAPFVTASAGIALSLDRSLQGDALYDLLLATANDTGEPGRNLLTGSGVVSPQRIQEYHQPGIVDMAVLRPLFHEDEDGSVHAVTVAAQNRGTVAQREVEMVVMMNDQEYQLGFVDIGRGRTVAHTFEVPSQDGVEDVVDVQVRVLLPGDIRPENNQIRALWMPVSE